MFSRNIKNCRADRENKKGPVRLLVKWREQQFKIRPLGLVNHNSKIKSGCIMRLLGSEAFWKEMQVFYEKFFYTWQTFVSEV